MRKYVLFYILLACALVGCTPMQKDQAAQTAINGIDIAAQMADVAGAAGVPFAGAAATLLGLIGTGLAGWNGKKHKKSKEALYRSSEGIHKSLTEIVRAVNNKEMDIDTVVNILPTLVKDVSVPVHEILGVKNMIKKDVNRLQKKGDLKKLS